jgi:hypothetical protein
MKRIFIFLLIFFSTYGIAYWWGVYDLRTNPPQIENDGDLATLGMMPIFLHLFGIGWAICSVLCYLVTLFLKSILHKSSRNFKQKAN